MAIELRSFFIGMGTVVAILGVGFGGGLVVGNVISGDVKTPNKLERAAKDASQPASHNEQVVAKERPIPNNADAPDGNPEAFNSPPSPVVVAPLQVPKSGTAQNASAPVERVVGEPVPMVQPAPVPEVTDPRTQPVQQPREAPDVSPSRLKGRQVSLPQPSDLRPLTRREEARLRREERRHERALRREQRREELAQRRRDEMRFEEADPPRLVDRQDDVEDEAPQRVMPRRVIRMRPRGLFEGFFGHF
jgi:hypothetical protein